MAALPRFRCPWCGRGLNLTQTGRYPSHRTSGETCEGSGMVPGSHQEPLPSENPDPRR